jgi:pyruvate formate lyase activating enzyme
VSADALFWEQLDRGSVRCTLCAHRCRIGEGGAGLCKVRGVREGRMQSLVYGHPATVVSDEIEKKPLYHFHPGTRALSLGTLGCNVLCGGCPNWQISHARAGESELARLPTFMPDEAVAMARKHKLQGVAWTYNDPVVWIEYVHDVARAFRAAGLYTAFITTGYMSAEALDYIAPHLDAFKFDLKAGSPEGWSRLTKVDDPAPAMEAAVRAAGAHGCHVEVVSNIVPGINDDERDLSSMARWIVENLGVKTPWHVTRFLPAFELSHLKPTPIAVLERGAAIGRSSGLEFVYVGNVPGHPNRHTLCPACGRTAIHRGDHGAEEVWVRDGRCVACGEDLRVVT